MESLTMIMMITIPVKFVEIAKIGIDMIRKLVIVAIALLAIVSWMVLFMSTVKFLLGE
jgi:hypothetical protein